MKPAYELAQVIERFTNAYQNQYQPNAYINRTLRAIALCRTASLGGHIDKCDLCGNIRISYNSCRNRHCPKCQNTHREAWIENRLQDLLPVAYFHTVFTVPDKLNHLFLLHPVQMYNLLFKTAWECIAQFSFTKINAETAMIAILHTWGQNLSLHPHLHCIIPAAGINHKNQFIQIKPSVNGKSYLFPVSNLSFVFRAKFMENLYKIFPYDKTFKKSLFKTPWVVYAKEPFGGPKQVVEYLGRYSHKVAISNHRIISIDQNNVCFSYRDYRDNKQKQMTLSGVEFLRRFVQHILPKAYVRIRHFGLLSATKRPLLREIQAKSGISIPIKHEKKNWKQLCIEHLNYNPDLCPCCKKGKMITKEYILPQRAPPYLLTIKANPLFINH